MNKNHALMLLCLLVLLMGCASEDEKVQKEKDVYEKTVLSLEEIEKKSPAKYISVSSSDKRNFFGQRVVKYKVTNKAKAVTYKDVDIKLSFFSKTGTLLMEDQEVAYDNFPPGTTKSYKSKYFAPKGTDSIALKVMKAKY